MSLVLVLSLLTIPETKALSPDGIGCRIIHLRRYENQVLRAMINWKDTMFGSYFLRMYRKVVSFLHHVDSDDPTQSLSLLSRLGLSELRQANELRINVHGLEAIDIDVEKIKITSRNTINVPVTVPNLSAQYYRNDDFKKATSYLYNQSYCSSFGGLWYTKGECPHSQYERNVTLHFRNLRASLTLEVEVYGCQGGLLEKNVCRMQSLFTTAQSMVTFDYLRRFFGQFKTLEVTDVVLNFEHISYEDYKTSNVNLAEKDLEISTKWSYDKAGPKSLKYDLMKGVAKENFMDLFNGLSATLLEHAGSPGCN